MEPGIIKHFKGKYYLNLGVGKDTETGKPYLVYVPVAGTEKSLWLRPLEMANAPVDTGQEDYAPRFTQVVRMDLLGIVKILARSIFEAITAAK